MLINNKSRLIFIFCSIEFLIAVFGGPLGFHLCTVSLIIFGFITNRNYQNWEIFILWTAPLFIIQSVLKQDISSFLQSVSYIFGIIAYQKISSRTNFDFNYLSPKFLFFVVLPLFVLFCVYPIPVKFPDNFGPVNFTFINRFVPSISNNFGINIGPPNFTKHFTGDLGLVSTLSSYFLYKSRKNKIFIFTGVFSCYLLLFSGSRTAIVCGIAIILLILVNQAKIRSNLSIIILLVFIIQFYLIDYAIGYVTPLISTDSMIGSLFKLENASNQYGITSNRNFLWSYHLDLFLTDPILGSHSDLIRFRVGDILKDGTIATAGSESYYTAMLAQYGILGLTFPFLHLFLFGKALKQRRLYSILWCTVFILGNVYNSSFNNIYGALNPVIYFLIFGNVTTLSKSQVEKKNREHNILATKYLHTKAASST